MIPDTLAVLDGEHIVTHVGDYSADEAIIETGRGQLVVAKSRLEVLA